MALSPGGQERDLENHDCLCKAVRGTLKMYVGAVAPAGGSQEAAPHGILCPLLGILFSPRPTKTLPADKPQARPLQRTC